jgi:hypothetical protein
MCCILFMQAQYEPQCQLPCAYAIHHHMPFNWIYQVGSNTTSYKWAIVCYYSHIPYNTIIEQTDNQVKQHYLQYDICCFWKELYGNMEDPQLH